MTNHINPILCEDPIQASKQREIVKYGLCTEGYDHTTRIINPKRDGDYYNRYSKTTGTVKNKIDVREE